MWHVWAERVPVVGMGSYSHTEPPSRPPLAPACHRPPSEEEVAFQILSPAPVSRAEATAFVVKGDRREVSNLVTERCRNRNQGLRGLRLRDENIRPKNKRKRKRKNAPALGAAQK